MGPSWFLDILRELFHYIDWVVYGVVNLVYQLFIMISELTIFKNATIEAFASRIYALLGIFMLFKVTFSLITYILNPDAFVDKSKGVGKLVTNFIVVIIGIIVVPYAFQAAYSLQAVILKENVIGNIIMGTSSNLSEEDAENYIRDGGKLMSFSTLSAFIRINPDVAGDDCSNNPVIKDASGNYSLSSACDGNDVPSAAENILIEAYKDNNVNALFSLINFKAKDKNKKEAYLFDYTILVSTIAGGFLAWILLIFCIDIAVRSVKLGFLQLIAPIPIISYVDPSGQKVFNNWLKECGKTYADLFIRLAGIYFALFVISNII